jgi:hypothetical protein
MAKKLTTEDEEQEPVDIQPMRHGSPDHAALLEAGYGMSVADAQLVVESHKAQPGSFSIAEVRKSEGMLAALAARPKVTATRPMWRRDDARA